MAWYTYLLKCSDDSLYAGITTDLDRRVDEHNNDSKKGGKYTKMRRPVKLVYSEELKNRSEAAVREASLRKLSTAEKRKLAAS